MKELGDRMQRWEGRLCEGGEEEGKIKGRKRVKTDFLMEDSSSGKIGGKVLLAYKVFNHTLEVVN